MNIPSQPDQELEQRLASPLLDVLIRGGLILALAMLCYRVFSPFLHLMVWALILAVTLYPLHQFLATKMGGKQGLAATLLVITGIVLIVTPTAILMSSLADSVRQLVHDVQNNTLKIPAPAPRCRALACRGQSDPRCLVEATFGLADDGAEHAAEDRRTGENSPRLRRQRRWWSVAVPGLVHHCRHHHGLRAVRQSRQPSDLRTHHRPRPGPRVRQTVH